MPVEIQNLLNTQIGFRQGVSTSYAISKPQIVYDNFDDGNMVSSIFIYIMEHLNVWEKILLSKLSRYGMCGIGLVWYM